MVLLVMCVGYFLVLLDVTIVNVALPHVGAGLHAGVSSLQWVVDGYAIALAALMLAGGTIGDLYGHKRVVLGGLGAVRRRLDRLRAGAVRRRRSSRRAWCRASARRCCCRARWRSSRA